MSILSYIRGKIYNLQRTCESFVTEIKSGYEDGVAGKPKAEHWVRYLQKQRKEKANTSNDEVHK